MSIRAVWERKSAVRASLRTPEPDYSTAELWLGLHDRDQKEITQIRRQPMTGSWTSMRATGEVQTIDFPLITEDGVPDVWGAMMFNQAGELLLTIGMANPQYIVASRDVSIRMSFSISEDA